MNAPAICRTFVQCAKMCKEDYPEVAAGRCGAGVSDKMSRLQGEVGTTKPISRKGPIEIRAPGSWPQFLSAMMTIYPQGTTVGSFFLPGDENIKSDYVCALPPPAPFFPAGNQYMSRPTNGERHQPQSVDEVRAVQIMWSMEGSLATFVCTYRNSKRTY